MNYINVDTSDMDTHTDLSIGTEFSLSDSSISSIKQQNGGFFWNKKDEVDINQKALIACKEKKFAVVEFFILNDMINDYCAKDANQMTILHHLVINYNALQEKNKVIDKILSSKNIKNFINIADVNKDTALIHATRTKNYELCSKLINNGADKKIKNSEGTYVVSEDDSQTSAAMPIDVKALANAPITSESVEERIRKLLASTGHVANVASNDSEATDNVNTLRNIHTETAVRQNDHSVSATTVPENTEEFLNKLVTNYVRRQEPQAGGSNLIEKMIAGKRKMKTSKTSKTSKKSGRKSVKASRQVTTHTTNSSSIEKYENELSRLIKSQSTEIHERVVKNIMDLMNIDEQKAKAYKSAVYQMVKDKFPNLGNLDRAIEMQKMTTKELLDSINIDKYMSEWEKKNKARLSETSEEKPKEKPKRRKASTESSDTPINTESSLTQTSVDFTESD